MPVAVLHVTATQPVAHLVVRLADVAPDGSVEQVSEGILNLTHRDSHADPTPLEPGRAYEVRVAMRGAGYRFPPGHRIQLRVASSHWPVIWPSPGAGELAILRGPGTPSRLELPLAPAGDERTPAPAFRTEPANLQEFGSETSEPVAWETVRDDLAGTVTVRTHEASTSVLPDGVSTLFVGESLVDDGVGSGARARVASRTRATTGSSATGSVSSSSPMARRSRPRRRSRWTCRSGSSSTGRHSSSERGAR